MKRRLEALVLVLGLAACGPRLGIRREVPPRADLAGSQVVAVLNARESAIDLKASPWSGMARTELTPRAVHRLEKELGRSGKVQVIPRCGDVCPQADTVIEVSVTNAQIEHGDAEKKVSKDGSVTLAVRVERRGGVQLFWDTYSNSRSGGVPGTKDEIPDGQLLGLCLEAAVDQFVADLYPRWIEESFRLEDEGALKPIVDLAAKGELDQAEALVRSVLQTNPENPKAIYDLGVIFTARGQLEQARDAFKAAAERDPKYKWYLADAQKRIDDRGTLQREGQ